MPEVALVELPPKKSARGRPVSRKTSNCDIVLHTVLVKQQNTAAVQIDGMSRAQARHCIAISMDKGGGSSRHSRPPPTTITLGGAILQLLVRNTMSSRIQRVRKGRKVMRTMMEEGRIREDKRKAERGNGYNQLRLLSVGRSRIMPRAGQRRDASAPAASPLPLPLPLCL